MAKRGANEGSIFKRKDGRWSAAISTGNGRRRTFYGGARNEVAEKLRQAQHAQAQGLPLPSERLTLEAFLTRWLEEVAKHNLRPRPFASYRQIVAGQLVPALGKIRLARLSPQDIQGYMNAKTAAGLAPNTVRNHHSVLRRALNQAEQWGLIPRNPARLVSPPRTPREEVHPLTPEQARLLLDALEGHRLETLFHLSLGLGLRQGEALGLAWQSVDLDAGVIRIERSLQRYEGAYHLDEVKTAQSRRAIGLPVQLVDQLRAHRARQLKERLRIGAAWEDEGWGLVFTTEFGAPLDGQVIRRALKRTLASAGLPEQRFHDLRHAAASFMLAEGVPMKVAQEVLGHSTIAVTADLYSHVAPAATREATERVGNLLWGTR